MADFGGPTAHDPLDPLRPLQPPNGLRPARQQRQAAEPAAEGDSVARLETLRARKIEAHEWQKSHRLPEAARHMYRGTPGFAEFQKLVATNGELVEGSSTDPSEIWKEPT